MKTFLSAAELNACTEWALTRGWALEPTPELATHEVCRLRNHPTLALFFRNSQGQYSTHGAGRELLQAYRRTKDSK